MLGILMRNIREKFLEELFHRLEASGFKDVRQAHIIVFLTLKGGSFNITDLAREAGMTKQSMSYLVNYLEEKDYLISEKGEKDSRQKIYTLSKKGKNILKKGEAISEAIEKEWAKSLGAEKFDKMKKSMAELHLKVVGDL
jgi:DNA-binding MarR family transcriptional regulator